MRDILKQAVTICLYIDEIQDEIYHNNLGLERQKISIIKRMVKSFLRRMEQSKYHEVTDNFGNTFYDNIQEHLEDEKSHRSTAIYLTYLQMQLHSFLRYYLPKKMGYGNYRRNTKLVSYYKPTLEILLR